VPICIYCVRIIHAFVIKFEILYFSTLNTPQATFLERRKNRAGKLKYENSTATLRTFLVHIP